MKRFFTLLIAVLLAENMFAQAPQKMSYQAVIRDNLDHLVTSQAIGIQISILQGSPTGIVVYTETQTPTTNDNGLISIEIGGGAGFSSIDWSAGAYFLKTEIDPAGETNYTISGTSQLLSVPFAFHAKQTENYTETDPVFYAWDKSTDISISKNQISDLGTYIETETQNLDDVLTQGTSAGNKNITNLADPVNNQDAVTKAYVDAILSRLSATGAIVSDADGNIYPTVRLGSQIWMAENLKTTRYSNGDLIGTTTPATLDISGEPSPKYQWAYDGNESNVAVYGRLYTWYAATDSRNICPTGWHVPTLEEWTAMEDYLIANGFNYDGTTSENKIAKALASTSGWEESITTGSIGNTDYPVKRNASGFTTLPGGLRLDDIGSGVFYNIGKESNFWTATESDGLPWLRSLYYEFTFLDGYGTDYKFGLSVRCLSD